MKLFEAQGTPNARRVHIFMAEKGIELPREAVDLRGGENIGEAFKAKNPFGRIPVLELDDGTCIAESVAICRYFEGTNPEPPLFGTDTLNQAQVEMWNRRAEIGFLMNVAMAFRNLTGFFKDREKVSQEWGAISQEVAADSIRLFDAHLADSEFLAGDSLSIADITLCCAYDFGRAVKVELPDDLPNLSRWHETLSARPSFSAT
ncbi:MAG: glutathione S-transferase family protein [Pseudomonadota bacterium]